MAALQVSMASLGPKKLVLRIKAGRLVSPTSARALTVDDVRTMGSQKMACTENLHKLLLLQSALMQIDAVEGTDSFHDREMELPPPWRTLKARASLSWAARSRHRMVVNIAADACAADDGADPCFADICGPVAPTGAAAASRKRPGNDLFAEPPRKMLKVDHRFERPAPGQGCVPMRSPTQACDVPAFLVCGH